MLDPKTIPAQIYMVPMMMVPGESPQEFAPDFSKAKPVQEIDDKYIMIGLKKEPGGRIRVSINSNMRSGDDGFLKFFLDTFRKFGEALIQASQKRNGMKIIGLDGNPVRRDLPPKG